MKKRSRSIRRFRRDPAATAFARDQRAPANDFAHAVWQIVRNRSCRNQKFRREYLIPPYTADFCCVALKLIVEVDGEHHQTQQGREHDERRDRYLAEGGYALLRIAGYQVLQEPNGVKRLIETAIDQRIAQLDPLTPDPHTGGQGRQSDSFGETCRSVLSVSRPRTPRAVELSLALRIAWVVE